MRKKLLEKSIDVLREKADDCLDLAKSQRAAADLQQESVNEQHLSARKLEKLSQTLVSDAVGIQDELELEEIRAEIALKKERLHPS